MPKTTKPCPGCGKVSPYRGANEVCGSCASKIKMCDELVLECKNESKKMFLLPYAPHMLPYIENSRAAQDAFFDLLMGVVEKRVKGSELGFDGVTSSTPPLIECPHNIYGSTYSGHGFISPKARAALQLFYDKLDKIIQQAYADGLDRGSSLLHELASGKITNEEINQIQVRSKA